MNKAKLMIKKKRIRARVSGTATTPRLAVFRSTKHIYAQLIDDTSSTTMATASDVKLDIKKTKKEKAFAVGEMLAEKAKTLKIGGARFDRGGFKYHGRVKELAEGARAKGLQL